MPANILIGTALHNLGTATSGGIVGGYIECVDYAAGFWSCRAFTQSGGGSEATPFSATVS